MLVQGHRSPDAQLRFPGWLSPAGRSKELKTCIRGAEGLGGLWKKIMCLTWERLQQDRPGQRVTRQAERRVTDTSDGPRRPGCWTGAVWGGLVVVVGDAESF